ncbi:MAG: orange carotenoid protein N-terminal domain-containing protein [Nostocaceae cyanobacterium]|nr:orange carotenoid protein N-terminal domain-containing protein [Nostocaceae cyanobacterium]
MAFTTDSLQNRFGNNLNYTTQNINGVTIATEAFKRLNIDDQLGLLWFAYTEMGKSITPAAPGAARLQLAEGLLNQIKQMSQEEQLQAMRDLAAKKNTQICRSYGVLSANTKLAFWYELAELMSKGIVIPVPVGYQISRDASQVLATITELDFGQQITVLRNAVVDMGVDPLA